MTDTRRETIAWALRRMRDYKEGRRRCVSTQMRAGHNALPVAVELIDELTRERDAYKRAKAENDDRFMGERDDAVRKVAEQAKEIERLRAVIAREHYRPKSHAEAFVIDECMEVAND